MKRFDHLLTNFRFDHAIKLVRISLGILYLWFGILKFFPNLSPAEELATNTMEVLTLGLIPTQICIILLASWETLIGLALLAGKYFRPVFYLLFVHMLCTFTPLVLFPLLSFKSAPLVFTMVGQYIMKNLVLLSAAILVYAYHLQNLSAAESRSISK